MIRCLAGLALGLLLSLPAAAAEPRATYTSEEIVATGHEYFGKASKKGGSS